MDRFLDVTFFFSPIYDVQSPMNDVHTKNVHDFEVHTFHIKKIRQILQKVWMKMEKNVRYAIEVKKRQFQWKTRKPNKSD